MKPFPPDSSDPLPKLPQPWAIAREAVVGIMASKFLAQLLVLFHNRQVSVATTPFRDPFESSAQALAGCLGLDNPFASPRLAPVVSVG
jgi:hypothetical protein